ncbi:MAG: hypothetical protein ACXWZB_10135, partial [Gaiellaceae bacterium]
MSPGTDRSPEPDGVGRPSRHEDEATGGDWELAVSELERGIAVRDVLRLVSVRVDLQRRRRMTRREPALTRWDAPPISRGLS